MILKSPQSVLTSTRKVNGRPRITYSAGAGKEINSSKKFHTKKPIRKDVNNNNSSNNKENSNNINNSKDRILGIGEIFEKDKTDKRKKKKKDNNIVSTNSINEQNKLDVSNTIIININHNKKEIDSKSIDDSDSDNDNNNNSSNRNNIKNSMNNNSNNNNNNKNKKRSESGKKTKNYTAPKSTTNSRARRSDLRKLNSESSSVSQETGQVASVQPPAL